MSKPRSSLVLACRDSPSRSVNIDINRSEVRLLLAISGRTLTAITLQASTFRLLSESNGQEEKISCFSVMSFRIHKRFRDLKLSGHGEKFEIWEEPREPGRHPGADQHPLNCPMVGEFTYSLRIRTRPVTVPNINVVAEKCRKMRGSGRATHIIGGLL